MSFTPVNIPLETVLLSSEALPKSLTKIVNNQSLLELYLEDLYNDLEINTTTKLIGETTPIASVNSNKYIVYATQDGSTVDTTYGIYITTNLATIGDANTGYFRPIDIGGGALGTELKTDDLIVTRTATLPSDVAIENLTLTSLTVSGETILAGSLIESVEDFQPVDLIVRDDSPVFTLYNTSKTTMFLTLQLDQTVYDGAWIAGTDVNIQIRLDATNPMANGQTIRIIVKELLDYTGAPITMNGIAAYSNGIAFIADVTPGLKFIPKAIRTDNMLVPAVISDFEPYDNILEYIKYNDGTNDYLVKI